MNWSIVKKLSGAALSFIALALAADFFIVAFADPGTRGAEAVGCYLASAMLVGFECQGFWASDIASMWLNLPVWAVYGLMFASYSLKAALLAVLVWSPLVIYVVASRKLAQHA